MARVWLPAERLRLKIPLSTVWLTPSMSTLPEKSELNTKVRVAAWAKLKLIWVALSIFRHWVRVRPA